MVGTPETALTLNLNDLTIAHGSAGENDGGGVFVQSGALYVTDSTFSANTAHNGGAIAGQGVVNVTNSTVSGNSTEGSNGGGLFIQDHSTANLKGTILAENTGGNCFNSQATISDNGYNLRDDDSCDFTGTGSENNDTNIGLAMTLAQNGGPI